MDTVPDAHTYVNRNSGGDRDSYSDSDSDASTNADTHKTPSTGLAIELGILGQTCAATLHSRGSHGGYSLRCKLFDVLHERRDLLIAELCAKRRVVLPDGFSTFFDQLGNVGVTG